MAMKDWKRSDYSTHSGYWLDDIFSSSKFDRVKGTNRVRMTPKLPAPVEYDEFGVALDVTGAFEDDSIDSVNLEIAIRLAAVRRAVSNFVRILTGNDKLVVKFNGGNDSYTDGNVVVISASSERKDFDVMVGLALHEASHCLLTDMSTYGALLFAGQPNGYSNFYDRLGYTPYIDERTMSEVFTRCFHPSLRPYLSDTTTAKNMCELLMTMLNICEDRRIDQFVFTKAPGYRPYYVSLYEKYFLSKEIDKALVNDPSMFLPSVESYVSRMINIMNPNASPMALKGLKEMYALVDVDHISRLSNFTPTESATAFFTLTKQAVGVFNQSQVRRRQRGGSYVIIENISQDHLDEMNYDMMYPTWKIASELLLKIAEATGYDFVQDHRIPPPPKGEEGEGEGEEGEGEGRGGGDGDLENLDQPQNGKYSPSKTQKAMDAQRKFLSGNIRKKKAAKRMADMVAQMEQAGAKLVEVGKDFGLPYNVAVVVLEKVTESILRSGWFYHGVGEYGGYGHYDTHISRGISMGQVLVNRLQIRNDPQITHYTRQKSGKVDSHMLAQLGMDIVSVFKRTRTETYKPVVVYLTLDASGSMGGDKWGNTIAVATAMAYLADKVAGIDVVISIRGSSAKGLGSRGGYGDTMPMVAVVHDSRLTKFVVAKKLLGLLRPAGGTPEALCYEATLELLTRREKKSDVYFVNFSDGEPSFVVNSVSGHDGFNYCGDTSTNHCRKVMQHLRNEGLKIMSYFISNWSPTDETRDDFKRSYGEAAEFTDVRNITMVLRTLQKLFSSRGDMDVSSI